MNLVQYKFIYPSQLGLGDLKFGVIGTSLSISMDPRGLAWGQKVSVEGCIFQLADLRRSQRLYVIRQLLSLKRKSPLTIKHKLIIIY